VGLALVAVAINLLPWPGLLAERLYLRVLLPHVSAVTAPVVDVTGFSLSALLLLCLVSVPLVVLVLGGRTVAGGVLRFWGGAALVLLLLFPFTFGLGYRLPDLVARQVVAPAQLTEQMHQELRVHVLTLLQTSSAAWRSPVTGANAGGAFTEASVAAASACVARLTHELRANYPTAVTPSRVKLLPSGLLLRFGFAGVVSPWLLEPHVDAGLPGASALAVALHEFAHSAGFAPEAEAEAVGLVAGLECEDQRVTYVAALRLASALAGGLGPDERAAYVSQWPAAAQVDARAATQASRRYAHQALTAGAEAAYELYLRSQGESAGLAEYGRGTELALRLLYGRSLAGSAPEVGSGL
jgi:hypothetical protein